MSMNIEHAKNANGKTTLNNLDIQNALYLIQDIRYIFHTIHLFLERCSIR
jgi:hypothetical protein